MNASFHRSLWILCVLVCLCLAGCDATGGVSKASFEKVNNGMTEQEVESILGSPTQEGNFEDLMAKVPGMQTDAKLPGMTYKIWVDGGNKITAQFHDGKLVGKSWVGN